MCEGSGDEGCKVCEESVAGEYAKGVRRVEWRVCEENGVEGV